MAESTAFLLAEMQENWSQARQSEDQRAMISNLIIIIATVILSVLAQMQFNKNTLLLAILLILLGLYGVVASVKLYERHQFHIHRARRLRGRLEELCPDTHVRSTLDTATNEHYAKHPILGWKIRLHYVWLGLHVLITVIGIISTVFILVRSQ